MAQELLLTAHLSDYKKGIDDLRASLIGLEKTDEEYVKTVGEIERRQGKLNEVLAIGKDNTQSLQQQYKAAEKELQKLTQGTAEYEAKLKEVGQLKDNIVDLKSQIKNAADDAQALNTILDFAKVGTSMYGAWSSAAAIFGVENEKVVQSIQKLQAATTLLNSLKQIQLALFDRGSRIYQLFNSAVVSLTTSEKAEAAASKGVAAAQEANAAATKTATAATKSFGKAIAATGIGAIVILLGALVANWDKVSAAIKRVIGVTDDYSDANEKLKESFEKVNKETDTQIKLMRAAGKSEKTILEYKKKVVEAQIAEVEAKIADIEATNAQIRSKNKWYATNAGIMKATLNLMNAAVKPLLFAWDTLSGTKTLDAFNSMINTASMKFADMATGIKGNIEEIEELKETANGLKDTLKEINVDIQVEDLKGGRKGGKDAVDEELKARKKLAKQEEEDLKRNVEEKRRDAQLAYVSGLTTEIEYKNELLTLDHELADGYENLAETYKDVPELKAEFEKKKDDAIFNYTLNKATASAEQRKKIEEETAKQIEETYKNAIRDIDFNADKQSIVAEIDFDTRTAGMDSGSIKYIEMEKELEHQLFDIRETARQAEIAATEKMYDDKIAQAAGNNAEIERLTKERNDTIREIELDGQKDRAELNKKDLKATADTIKAKREQYKQLANGINSLMGSISNIMAENLRQKIDEGTISQEEAEKEFERQKSLQYSMALISTIAGAAEAYESAQRLGPPMGPIIGAVNMAAAIATGMAQVMQIKNSKFGQEGSASSSAGGGAPAVADIQVAPLLNESLDMNNITAMSAQSMAEGNNDNRVYILQSDITKSNQQVEVRENETTF